MTDITTPHTPSKTEEKNREITYYISKLSHEWDLDLRIPQKTDSPKTIAPQLSDTEREVINEVRYLTFKGLIETVFHEFEVIGQDLYNGWVEKPNAQRGKLPECTIRRPRRVTPYERQQLMDCFVTISRERSERLKHEERARFTKSPTRRSVAMAVVDDRPIPFKSPAPALRSAAPEKRMGDLVTDGSLFKKPKIPEAHLLTSITRPVRSASTSFTSFTTSSQCSSVFDQVYNKSFQSSQETLPGVYIPKLDFETNGDNPLLSSNYSSTLDPMDVADLVGVDEYVDFDDQVLSQNMQDVALTSPGRAKIATLPEAKLRTRLDGIFREHSRPK